MRYGATQDTWPRCWIVCGCTAALGAYLWPLGQQAGSVGRIATMPALMWVSSLRNFNAGLCAWDKDAAHSAVRRKSRRSQRKHGRPRF